MAHKVEIEWTVEEESGEVVTVDVTAEYTEGKPAGLRCSIDNAYPAEGPWVEDVEARRRDTGEVYELDPYTERKIADAICEQAAEGRRGRRW